MRTSRVLIAPWLRDLLFQFTDADRHIPAAREPISSSREVPMDLPMQSTQLWMNANSLGASLPRDLSWFPSFDHALTLKPNVSIELPASPGCLREHTASQRIVLYGHGAMLKVGMHVACRDRYFVWRAAA
jgi:hypothetical protein